METVHQLIWQRIEQHAHRCVMRYKSDGRWQEISWRALGELVRRAGLGLLAQGIQPGDRVAILSENRPEWAIADIAVLSVAAADVPIYATNRPEDVAYILADSGAVLAFVSDAAMLEKITAHWHSLPELRCVVTFDTLTPPADTPGTVISYRDLLLQGDAEPNPEQFDERRRATTGADLLTLIYTSGTTGTPKGVTLTHANLMANLRQIRSAVDLRPDDQALSFLPLCHGFERTAGYYALLDAGGCIAYAESIPKLIDNIGEIKPTVMCSVPRIYEKVYAKFMAGVEQSGLPKRLIVEAALRVGNQVSQLVERGRPIPLPLALANLLADQLVFSKLSQRLGGRIRFLISGGAPLSSNIARFFHAAGMLILEGYGLTETSPVLSVNRVGKFRFGSVGVPVDELELRFDPDDGEILVRGPNVTSGYYHKPEKTAEAFSDDGWFRTGDIGKLDDDGFLHITDRKKNLIKTAGGKYIAPQKIENELQLAAAIDQVCVIGDQRPYCVALVVPNPEERGRHGDLKAHIGTLIDATNETLARYETIKRYLVLDAPFTVDNGMLTPTLKLKRKAIMTTYADQIDALYALPKGDTRKTL